MRRPVALAVCCALSLATTTRLSHAFEREWHLGGGIGISSFTRDYQAGPALVLHGAYGLSDMFDARIELAGSRHAFGEAGVAERLSASGGLLYKVDVIQWIPYIGVLVGYTTLKGDVARGDGQWLEWSVPLGIDYAVSRNFAVGAELRSGMLLGDEWTGLFTGTLTAEYRFGW